jgi:hypothetical protein
MVPTMRAAQRVRNKVGLYFDRRTDTPLVQRRDGSTVELGRLNIEEQGGTAGEMLTLRPDGRYRSGPMANGWRAHTRGIVIWDDFTTGREHHHTIGGFPWVLNSEGTNQVSEKVQDSDAAQRGKAAGIVRIRINSGASNHSKRSLDLGADNSGTAFMAMPFADDTWCVSKMRVADATTEIIVWSGMQGERTKIPDDGSLNDNMRMIGFLYRARSSPGNWQGICRNSNSGGSPLETLVDLGVAGNSTWHEFAWNYRTRGPNVGVQFYVDGAAVGSVVTTNIPSDGEFLSPQFGTAGTVTGEGTTSGSKEGDTDYFGFFSPCGDRW